MTDLDNEFDYVDYTINKNKVIEDKNPDLEIMEHYDDNLDELEDEE